MDAVDLLLRSTLEFLQHLDEQRLLFSQEVVDLDRIPLHNMDIDCGYSMFVLSWRSSSRNITSEDSGFGCDVLVYGSFELLVNE